MPRVCVALLLVAPLVFRAPEGPAAREARRPHFVRRRASKPARALRSLRRPPHRRRLWCCVVSARPRRRPPAPRQVPPAPSTPVGPGCFVCPWAAARPRAACAASFARRVASKPGLAPPPPTGTAAMPHRNYGCRVQLSLAAWLRPSPISHVIPPRLFQTLNSDCWNCNVF